MCFTIWDKTHTHAKEGDAIHLVETNSELLSSNRQIFSLHKKTSQPITNSATTSDSKKSIETNEQKKLSLWKCQA